MIKKNSNKISKSELIRRSSTLYSLNDQRYPCNLKTGNGGEGGHIGVIGRGQT